MKSAKPQNVELLVDDSSDSSSQSQSQQTFDLSLLRTPILTATTGFLEAKKAYDDGTVEIRRLLTSECDLMYECKVCRNIFRSLTNFISHKRVYCRKLFNPSQHYHFKNDGFIDRDISTIIQAEESQSSVGSKSKKSTDENASKDLSSIVERLKRKQHTNETNLIDFYDKINHKIAQEGLNRRVHVLKLDQVPETSAAVYQTFNKNGVETIRDEITEVENQLTENNPVLGPDGKIIAPNETSQEMPAIHNDSDLYYGMGEGSNDSASNSNSIFGNYKCDVCNVVFASEKSLKWHFDVKHNPSTIMYPCPTCQKPFLTPGMVIRHLNNDHKKSNRRIRTMREAIFKKGMRKDQIVVKDTSQDQTKPQSADFEQEEARKAWMENLEHFDKGPMCTVCCKTFDRKARLDTHMLTCGQKKRPMTRAKEEEISKAVKNIKLEPDSMDENSNPYDEASTSKNRSNLDNFRALLRSLSNSPNLDQEISVSIKQENDNLPENTVTENVNKRKRGTKVALRNDNDEILWDCDLQVDEKKDVKDTIQNSYQEPVPATLKNEMETKPVETSIQPATTEAKPKKRRRRTKKIKVEQLDESVENGDTEVPIVKIEGKVPCPKCNRYFDSAEAVQGHLAYFHIRQKRFLCTKCEFKGYRRVDTINHLITVHKYEGSLDDIGPLIDFRKEKRQRKKIELNVVSDHISSIIDSVSRVPETETEAESSALDTSVLETSLNGSIVSQYTSNDMKSEEPDVSTLSVNETPTPTKRRGRARVVKESDQSSDLENSIKKTKIMKRNSTPAQIKEEPKEPEPEPIASSSSQSSKRPIRNRIKPVNKDFVYEDLSQLGIRDEELLDFAIPELPPVTKPSRRRASVIPTSTSPPKIVTPIVAAPIVVIEAIPAPKKLYGISEVKGAALQMAKLEVAVFAASFSKPPELPQERPTMPNSPMKSVVQPKQQIKDWPVVKKQRKIGSIVKESKIVIENKKKYKRRAGMTDELTEAKVKRRGRTKGKQTNEIVEPDSNLVPNPASFFTNLLQEFQSDEKFMLPTDRPSIANRVLETLAKNAGNNNTTVTSGVDETRQQGKNEEEFLVSPNRKSVVQRLAENRTKKLQRKKKNISAHNDDKKCAEVKSDVEGAAPKGRKVGSHQGKSKPKSVARSTAKMQKKPVIKSAIRKFVKTRAKVARKDEKDRKAPLEDSSANLDA